MKLKIFNLFALTALILGLMGCEKLVEIQPALNETPSSAIFASDRTAIAALSAMHSSLISSQGQTELDITTSLMADDLRYRSSLLTNQEYYSNTYTALTASPALFTNFYNIIYQANAIIEGLAIYSGTSDGIKRQLTAEAKLMRAYCYFHLINHFGDVPLVTQTDVNVTAFLPRAGVTAVYSQVITDLTEAKASLLSDFSFTANNRIGVNRFTAAALLARAYLFTGDYSNAEVNASEVISSNLFSMIPSANIANGVFQRNNRESIWQLGAPVLETNQYTVEAGTLLPSSNTVEALGYDLQPNLVNLFETNDLRGVNWISRRTLSGTVYNLPFKYKFRTNAEAIAANSFENQSIIRLAEMYLIRAEARAQLGANLNGALADLNVVHQRAGLPASITLARAALLDEVALEFRKEFFCEQGFRWYNLKRTGRADEILSSIKATYRPQAKLYPIPQGIINANPQLVQNPGF